MSIADIGREMASQNNRSTQSPMFAIMTDRKVYMPPANGYDLERERKEETEPAALCGSCADIYEVGENPPEDCTDCEDEAFDYFKYEEHLEVELAGTFFTAKACQDHIDANSYHYHNPRVYGISSWRNPEMFAVQKHLIGLGG